MPSEKSRVAVLQRRRVRKSRAPDLIARWAAVGVTASALSDLQHEALLDSLRNPNEDRSRTAGSLSSIVADLGNASEMVVVIGWDVDEEPGLLLQSASLAQSNAFFRATYPDGFVAANQPLTRALIVDFEDNDFEADEVQFPAT